MTFAYCSYCSSHRRCNSSESHVLLSFLHLLRIPDLPNICIYLHGGNVSNQLLKSSVTYLKLKLTCILTKLQLHMRYVDRLLALRPPRSYLPPPVVRVFHTNAPVSGLLNRTQFWDTLSPTYKDTQYFSSQNCVCTSSSSTSQSVGLCFFSYATEPLSLTSPVVSGISAMIMKRMPDNVTSDNAVQ